MENQILRKGLIDWQIGKYHNEVNFDPEEYVIKTKEIGLQELLFTAKTAYGYAYYKSKLVPNNPVVSTDYLKAFMEAGEKHNLNINAYYNVLLDDEYAKNHKDHIMRNSKGEAVIGYRYYYVLCPNSPYIEIVTERVEELIRNYRPKGLFFDITYFQADTCYCQYCKVKYKEKYGQDMQVPSSIGTIHRKNWDEFKRDSRYNLLLKLKSAAKKISPDIKVSWNGSGSPYLLEAEIDSLSDALTTEFHAPDYLDGMTRVKWIRDRNESTYMTTPYELGSWGDWTINTTTTFKTVFMSSMCNGSAVSIDHVPYPSGDFAASYNKDVVKSLKNVCDYVIKHEKYLKNAESASDIALFASINSIRLSQWKSLFANGRLDELFGGTKILMQGKSFDIIDEMKINKTIARYSLIILPNCAFIDENTKVLLETFVKEGGNLIVTGETSLYDNSGNKYNDYALGNMLGVKYKGRKEYSVSYIYDISEKINNGLPEMPMLYKNGGLNAVEVELVQANALAYWAETPFEATLERHVYHEHPHPYKKTKDPAITINECGKGKCIYIAANIFTEYLSKSSPWVKKLLSNCIDFMNHDGIIKIDAPDCIQCILNKKNNDYILHLINISGALYDKRATFYDKAIPIYNIKVKIKSESKSVYSVNCERELDFTYKDGFTYFEAYCEDVHDTIFIKV